MAGRDAFGTLFQRSDMDVASPEFVTLARVLNIGGPDRSRDTYDVTAHDSDDQYREFIGGLKDGGEVTLTLNYDPDQGTHEQLDDDFEDDDPRDYRIVVLPGDDEWEWNFSGIITRLGDGFPHDGKMERSVTIKVTGKPVLSGGPD